MACAAFSPVADSGRGSNSLPKAGPTLTTLTWNSENRMVGLQDSSGTVLTATYNAEGKRHAFVFVDSGGNLNSVAANWDQENVLIDEIVGSGFTADNVYTDFPGYWGGLVSAGVQIDGTLYPSAFAAFDGMANLRALEWIELLQA